MAGLPLSFSKPDVPDPNMSKGAAWDSGDSPKHYCNCLSRDTIANAAAKIGPAVVNLSVSQGSLFIFFFPFSFIYFVILSVL